MFHLWYTNTNNIHFQEKKIASNNFKYAFNKIFLKLLERAPTESSVGVFECFTSTDKNCVIWFGKN